MFTMEFVYGVVFVMVHVIGHHFIHVVLCISDLAIARFLGWTSLEKEMLSFLLRYVSEDLFDLSY